MVSHVDTRATVTIVRTKLQAKIDKALTKVAYEASDEEEE
jgi:hypothetical protein